MADPAVQRVLLLLLLLIVAVACITAEEAAEAAASVGEGCSDSAVSDAVEGDIAWRDSMSTSVPSDSFELAMSVSESCIIEVCILMPALLVGLAGGQRLYCPISCLLSRSLGKHSQSLAG